MVISLLFSESQKSAGKFCLEVILESLEQHVPLHPMHGRPVRAALLLLRLIFFRSRTKTSFRRPCAHLHQPFSPQPTVPAHSWFLLMHSHCRERDEGGGPPLLA